MIMYLLQNVSLAAYSTMRLGGIAAYLTEVTTRQEVVEAVQWSESQHLPVIMIGSGSNIIWRDEGFPGLVIVNRIQFVEPLGEGNLRYITAGAGVVWDDFVAQVTAQGLTGIECLSLIPGTVGATPIQNVGAYGQEVSSSIMTLEVYDRQTKQLVNLRSSECEFGYRTSRFKTKEKGRYFITAVTFFLNLEPPSPPYYDAVSRYLEEHQIKEVTSQVLREVVSTIRRARLPDPATIANNGSFFANPIISGEQFLELRADNPEMMYWATDDDQIKLSAAWLIEHAGFKDVHDPETGMATWPQQALVLINESAHSTAQLLAFKKKIVDAVEMKYHVTLQQEPELLP